jgi:DNA invertase Pin-like site-specific DNA recombinase
MRAVGIIRVSKVAGREGESFASPSVQRQRIESVCKANGWELTKILEEMDVSGGKALTQRPGLSGALELVESRKADIVVAAYFDRLFRSLSTQAEVLERLERAGGRVWSVDMGEVSNATAGQWLTGTLIGAISEYYRRQTGEKLREAAVRAAARGVYAGKIPLGYVKGTDGRLEPDPALGPVIGQLFEQRAAGASLRDLCKILREHGVERWPGPVSSLLRSRVYLGEVKYGKTVTTDAHPALVSPDVWRRAQLRQGTAGRKPKAPRLLARLQVLRCSGCGRPMALATGDGSSSPRYRCLSAGQTAFCPAPVTIRADVAEEAVETLVRQHLAGQTGHNDGAEDAEAKRGALEAAQEALDGALATFQAAGLTAEPAAVERLTRLRTQRDHAQAELDRLADGASVVIDAGTDWNLLTLDERRALIRAVVASAIVVRTPA